MIILLFFYLNSILVNYHRNYPFFWKRRIRRRIGGEGKRICKSIKSQVIIHPIITMNQLCKVCGEPAAGYHFGAFTCEGCKVSWICVFRFRLNLRILYYCSSIVGVRRGVISVLALGFNVCFFCCVCPLTKTGVDTLMIENVNECNISYR